MHIYIYTVMVRLEENRVSCIYLYVNININVYEYMLIYTYACTCIRIYVYIYIHIFDIFPYEYYKRGYGSFGGDFDEWYIFEYLYTHMCMYVNI
jgi:hypothetical protein